MSSLAPVRESWDPEALDVDEMILNMGPQHPSTHGVLRLELKTDGEIVKAVRPHIAYLHRCFEKHWGVGGRQEAVTEEKVASYGFRVTRYEEQCTRLEFKI